MSRLQKFQIENKLRKMGQTQRWPKNTEELQERITLILNSIPKSWFKKTFSPLPETWKAVVRHRGRVSDYFLPKRRISL